MSIDQIANGKDLLMGHIYIIFLVVQFYHICVTVQLSTLTYYSFQ